MSKLLDLLSFLAQTIVAFGLIAGSAFVASVLFGYVPFDEHRGKKK